MSVTGWAQVLSVLFAAIAAGAGLWAVLVARREGQAARKHRLEERDEWVSEARERRDAFARETDVRRLAQLSRIADVVALVRQTAKDDSERGPLVALRGDAPFFWNARRQLDLELAILDGFGGVEEPLTECHKLATGSPMDHLDFVVSAATGAFDELARAAAAIEPAESGE